MTVPPLPAEWLAEPPILDDISTVDGWQHYVEHRDAYQPPALISRAEYDRLPDGHRSLYDMARGIGIANLPRHDTPMGVATTAAIATTLRLNTDNSAPGVRPGLFVSADAGLGKSTLVREIAAEFDTSLRQKAQFFPGVVGNRDRWIPVAWVNVPPKVTISGLCRDILAFYGDVPRSRTYEPELTARVRQIIVECGTRLLVLDDITRLKMHREADQNAADFIRALMETGATVLGIGVNVEQSGLLYEGQASTRNRRLLTQTRRRFTVHTLGSFTDETSEAFAGWLSHLKAIEEDLPLLDKAPGMLTGDDTPAYLLRRTGGVVGTLTRLVSEASIGVLGQRPSGPRTGEYLSREVLDSIVLDHAAENQGLPEPTALSPKATARRGRARNGAFNGKRARDGAA
ncbi:hypothetical protein DQ237_08915 [Blastococcus sp. TF02-8]|uniref:ATP-binding protein n=1 Tax=Blastococcus sp. TF02-8 TaxID=2250574 RepID=UPI000DE8041D|nr:ATP-binding protein [Blastococcus sp. TF02-8]RBY96715.1 hypothetical protein DQ237_08915 [Blastococcus sp. TF02-8]